MGDAFRYIARSLPSPRYGVNYGVYDTIAFQFCEGETFKEREQASKRAAIMNTLYREAMKDA